MTKVDLTQLAAKQDVLRMLEQHGGIIAEAAAALRDGKLDKEEAAALQQRLTNMNAWEETVLIPALRAVVDRAVCNHPSDKLLAGIRSNGNNRAVYHTCGVCNTELPYQPQREYASMRIAFHATRARGYVLFMRTIGPTSSKYCWERSDLTLNGWTKINYDDLLVQLVLASPTL
jgi:hypothetical protein